MADRIPVSVVTDDTYLSQHQQAHSLGNQLVGFEHLLHTGVPTDDSIPANDMWAPDKKDELQEPEGSFDGEESDVDTPEIRTKMAQDRVDESDSGSSRESDAQEEVDNTGDSDQSHTDDEGDAIADEGGAIADDDVGAIADDDGGAMADDEEVSADDEEAECRSEDDTDSGNRVKRERSPSQEMESRFRMRTNDQYERKPVIDDMAGIEEEVDGLDVDDTTPIAVGTDNLTLPMYVGPAEVSREIPPTVPSPPPSPMEVDNVPLAGEDINPGGSHHEEDIIPTGSVDASPVPIAFDDTTGAASSWGEPESLHPGTPSPVFDSGPAEVIPVGNCPPGSPLEMTPVGNCPPGSPLETTPLRCYPLASTPDVVAHVAHEHQTAEVIEVAAPSVPADVSVTSEPQPGEPTTPTEAIIVGVTPGLVTVKVEKTSVPLVSNVGDPILIDSDEDDALWRAVKQQNPEPPVSDLSDGPDDPPAAEGSDRKMSRDKFFRVQLSRISKEKISKNREILQHNRQLAFDNMKLQRETTKLQEQLAKAQAVIEKETKAREEANETLRSAGIAHEEFISSPSGPLTQLTTSVASAPELSGSEALNLSQPEVVPETEGVPETEMVPSTQVQK